MRTIGSQTRETLQEANAQLVARIDDDTVVIRDLGLKRLDVYAKRDDYAGYVIEIDGVGYEFVRTATTSDLESCEVITR